MFSEDNRSCGGTPAKPISQAIVNDYDFHNKSGFGSQTAYDISNISRTVICLTENRNISIASKYGRELLPSPNERPAVVIREAIVIRKPQELYFIETTCKQLILDLLNIGG